MTQLAAGAWHVVSTTDQTDIPAGTIFPNQVHAGVIVAADALSAQPADGVYTTGTLPVGIQTADCVPLFLLTAEAACALHVSRKTLLKGLLDRVPDVLDPAAITHVIIGPHICQDHFVFEYKGLEVAAFEQRYPYAVQKNDDGWHLSPDQAARHYFKDWGISPTIVRDDRCTFEDPVLPSYKRDRTRQRIYSVVTRFVAAG